MIEGDVGIASLEGLGTTFRKLVPRCCRNRVVERLGTNEARWDGVESFTPQTAG